MKEQKDIDLFIIQRDQEDFKAQQAAEEERKKLRKEMMLNDYLESINMKNRVKERQL